MPGDDQAACACTRVRYDPVCLDKAQGRFSERWVCDTPPGSGGCGAVFMRVPPEAPPEPPPPPPDPATPPLEIIAEGSTIPRARPRLPDVRVVREDDDPRGSAGRAHPPTLYAGLFWAALLVLAAIAVTIGITCSQVEHMDRMEQRIETLEGKP